MRIALLSHLASRSAPTGAEHSLSLLARGLQDRGHDVAVSAPGPWALATGLKAVGVDVEVIPVRACWLVQYDRQPWWRQAARAARYGLPDTGRGELRRWLEIQQPDVVHVNCLPHLRGAEAARSLGLPVVWHLREILPPGQRRRWFAGRLRRDATRIVAVSEAVAGWLRDEGLGDLVSVVHNGVEAPDRMPDRGAAREAFSLPADCCVVGLFSQLVEHKGALDFVQAAHRAGSENTRLWFLIAGHGPARFARQLHDAITAGPAADRIRLVPPQPEIWPLLGAVDVAAVTTLWPDPLPRVVMEAMAMCKPVVGYSGGGVPEMVVDGETGLLCASGDVGGLAAAFGRLAGDDDLRLRMGEAGYFRARELFSVERHVDRMEAVLKAASR